MVSNPSLVNSNKGQAAKEKRKKRDLLPSKSIQDCSLTWQHGLDSGNYIQHSSVKT